MSRILPRVLLVVAAILLAIPSAQADIPADHLAKLKEIVAGKHRDAANAARDKYRHPVETLAFFGLRDDMTVIEIQPGGAGWWTEILAPYLRDRGRYYAAHPVEGESKGARATRENFAKKLATYPAIYDKVEVTPFSMKGTPLAPPGTVDMVLTFRNLHNWVERGNAVDLMRNFHAALKPGGILAMEDHRAKTDKPQDPYASDGYVREDYCIELAKQAGFTLLARSEVNANPKDTKDYKAGVWTLPPSYRLKDEDRAKYQAIGESDRFTLTFVKR
jgi:predicted methyltransferase